MIASSYDELSSTSTWLGIIDVSNGALLHQFTHMNPISGGSTSKFYDLKYIGADVYVAISTTTGNPQVAKYNFGALTLTLSWSYTLQE